MTKKNIKRIHNKICNDEQCVYNVLPATFRARATGIKFNDVHILSILYIKQDNYQKDFYFFFPIKRSHTSRVLDAHPCLPSNKKQISLRLELGDS